MKTSKTRHNKKQPRLFLGATRFAIRQNILMGDRIILEGRCCGNLLRDCPRDFLQSLVDRLLGTAAERSRIQHYLSK
jgi:hypothetical protein